MHLAAWLCRLRHTVFLFQVPKLTVLLLLQLIGEVIGLVMAPIIFYYLCMCRHAAVTFCLEAAW